MIMGYIPVTISKRRKKMESLKKFLLDEEGASAIEYGLLAGLIALLIIVAVTGVGTKLNELFTAVDDGLPPPPAP
jgi:pilus assembly protein Flp/PilA